MSEAIVGVGTDGGMQTYGGGAFFPVNPDPDKIDIRDIAHSLSMQCRYAGHCRNFYSVAEHCVHICDVASDENKLAALMHDASEAYLVDIPRPVKPKLVGYFDIESQLMAVIAEKFGFTWPLPKEVKHLDGAILADERQQNMNKCLYPNLWGAMPQPLNITLQFWSPAKAYAEFMTRFTWLTKGPDNAYSY